MGEGVRPCPQQLSTARSLTCTIPRPHSMKSRSSVTAPKRNTYLPLLKHTPPPPHRFTECYLTAVLNIGPLGRRPRPQLPSHRHKPLPPRPRLLSRRGGFGAGGAAKADGLHGQQCSQQGHQRQQTAGQQPEDRGREGGGRVAAGGSDGGGGRAVGGERGSLLGGERH